jgi:hypothetical protein
MAITVKKSTPPESKEILAEAITRISESLTKLSASGLNRDAIIILLHDHTKIAKRDIKIILESLSRLRGWYCH